MEGLPVIMKKLLIIALLFYPIFYPFGSINNTFTMAASLQEQKEELDLEVNSIKLGSSINQVYKKLGKPIKIITKENKDVGCASPSVEKHFKYKGLIVVLFKEFEEQEFYVISIEVTSANWKISRGVKLGMDLNAIKERLATPFNNESDKNGEHQLGYVNNDDATYTNFYFKENKLVRVYCAALLC